MNNNIALIIALSFEALYIVLNIIMGSIGAYDNILLAVNSLQVIFMILPFIFSIILLKIKANEKHDVIIGIGAFLIVCLLIPFLLSLVSIGDGEVCSNISLADNVITGLTNTIENANMNMKSSQGPSQGPSSSPLMQNPMSNEESCNYLMSMGVINLILTISIIICTVTGMLK